MLEVKNKLGISGEFSVIVRRADGSIKFEAGMQPNLMLDNCISHFLGIFPLNNYGVQHSTYRSNAMEYCLVGSGNSTPAATDLALQNFVAKSSSVLSTDSGSEPPSSGVHEGYVKVYLEKKYAFDGINNENITEVGLASYYGDDYINGTSYGNSYALMTRALIKDKQGKPISVTVLEGEVLEVIYRINVYVSIERKTGTFTLTTTKDGEDTTDTFEYFLQPNTITASSSLYGNLYFAADGYGLTSFGVKEADNELTADYDLNDVVYQSITYTDTTALGDKVEGSATANSVHSKFTAGYINSEVIERAKETGRKSYKVTTGIYSNNHTNGIRAFSFGVGVQDYTALVEALVVLKNRANGQGIKKTNRQLWEFVVSFTLSRWES